MIDAFVQTITDCFIGTFPFLSNLNDLSFQSYGDELIEATITSMMAMIQTSIRSITVIIQSFTQTLTILIITFIATCMMVYDYYFLKVRVLNYVSDKLISKLK